MTKTKGTATYENIENLAFTHWKYAVNEKAYEAKLIPKAAYEFARNELQKAIDSLCAVCYNVYSEKRCQ